MPCFLTFGFWSAVFAVSFFSSSPSELSVSRELDFHRVLVDSEHPTDFHPCRRAFEEITAMGTRILA